MNGGKLRTGSSSLIRKLLVSLVSCRDITPSLYRVQHLAEKISIFVAQKLKKYESAVPELLCLPPHFQESSTISLSIMDAPDATSVGTRLSDLFAGTLGFFLRRFPWE